MSNNWPTKKLGEVTKIEGGGTPSTKNPLFWNGDVLWLTPKELSDFSGREIFDTERKITSEGLKHSKLFPAGAVLFTSRAPIGYVAIAGIQMATNQGFKNFICNEKVLNNGFLYYFLKLKTKYLQSLGRGATFTEISRSILAKVDIPLPPLEIQKQIVERLDKIVAAQKLNDDLIQKADELFQSLLHKELNSAGPAYTPTKQHTNKLEYVGMSGSRSKTPADASAFVKTSEDKKAMAGKKDWEVKKLGDIAEIIMGQSPPSSTYNERGEGLPFFQGKAEFGEIYPTPLKYCPKPTRIAEAGDILMSVRAPVGNINLAKERSGIGRGLGAIRAREGIDQSFLYFFFIKNENSWSRLSVGSTFLAIRRNNLDNLKVPLPPIKTQKQIVAKLSAAQDYKTQLLAQKSKLKELFNSVLAKSFNGQA